MPIEPSQPDNATLSGESLQGLDSRSLNDNATFFPQASSRFQPESVALPDNESENETPAISLFGIKLSAEESPSDSDDYPSTYLELSDLEVSAGGSSLDSEQVVNVKYRLLSP
ncbi:hypothetical protein MC7420_6788 [Coleofasciculus chthonoplastes PCC 7420]|uniref:Uncharacterized protein n=2 Tax=Coleofasciculaceae TaxID=1892251 RepID=B4VWL4_9CYAN|nr:hypothetical protein MC7420_6788 [Coleofasciculus chthonoplastes PCC 7420]